MVDYKARLQALRQVMKDTGLDAFIIPQTDAWQSESLYPCDERMHHICGLEASAGYVVVTHDKAAVLIDGRYSLAAKQQVDLSVFDIAHYTQITPEDWAAQNIAGTTANGRVIGIDPWLHTRADYRRMTQKEADNGSSVKCVSANPVDAIWTDRPAPPAQTAILHDIKFSGQSVSEKFSAIAPLCDGKTLIAAPDCLAWLLNLRTLENTEAPGLRGYGIFDPVDMSLALYTDVDCTVFPTDDAKVTFHPLNAIKTLSGIIRASQTVPAAFEHLFDITDQDGPVALVKACKNAVEQQGIRDCHLRDARAVKNVIAWVKSAKNPSEKDVEARLIMERSKNNMFRGVSFGSIVGWNANGAKIHGHPTDTVIKGSGLLLVDSGGQYDDGTTDITRTIAIGTPSAEMKEKYTLVLKSHIALATAIFPGGTTGVQLDAITRAPLWAAGINFAHGTGHGVGHFLNVHEGPVNISPLATKPLKPGMLLSNEPGYYKENAFGIRLENLMLVQEYLGADNPKNETGVPLYHFETVTFVPFDGDCIIRDMLTDTEKTWLDAYQKKSAA